MKSQRVVLYCDLCERSEDDAEGVATRQVHIDLIDVEAEVCADCWQTAIMALVPLARVGRKPKQKARRLVVQGGTVTYPDTDWQLTAHALMRIGERHLDVRKVIEAADHYDLSRPSRHLPEAYVRESAGLSVVVIPQRKVIVTAMPRGSSSGPIEREAAQALGEVAS